MIGSGGILTARHEGSANRREYRKQLRGGAEDPETTRWEDILDADPYDPGNTSAKIPEHNRETLNEFLDLVSLAYGGFATMPRAVRDWLIKHFNRLAGNE